jgi:UDP-N-acetylmuramoylalanine--D-glutamate ligase
MTENHLSERNIAIFGTGVTGLSVARFLSARNLSFIVVDSRDEPPGLVEILSTYPGITVYTGPFNSSVLDHIDLIILSPGLSPDEPVLIEARDRGIEIVGDLTLFYSVVTVPVITITGSNGKSTVTSLVGEMASASGLDVGIGGNLGTPMLDLVNEDRQLYILELSSFQLETVDNNKAAVAVLLNISSDHMDRYATMEHYIRAKHRVFGNDSVAIVNRQDQLTASNSAKNLISFGLDEPDEGQLGVRQKEGIEYLFIGEQCLLAISEIALKGAHNISNVAAAVAIGESIKLPREVMTAVLKDFNGLDHRCQTVATISEVVFINDSKGTNVGATMAAITSFGLSQQKNIILIAGGQGKDQDFDVLAPRVGECVKLCILFGEDANQIYRSLQPVVPVELAPSLVEAVSMAKRTAEAGDTVLFSPACASFDQFSSFEERGECFTKAVLASVQSTTGEMGVLC